MNKPIVTVIIPTYNGADYLGEAIQSVLDQTYPNFELIIVNDASPDNTSEVVKQFGDARLKYIVHQDNQGAVAARDTGIQASSGDFIAFLDQDDLFHAEKLQTHVSFLEKHPDIGVTYNARFELDGSTELIREIWQPPPFVTLSDLILSFPFTPSDTVFRRKWVFSEGIWDSFVSQGEEVIVNGGEYVYTGRLFLAGCRFAGVGRALNYRRYHRGRIFSDLKRRCESELVCQDIIFTDPRCPADVLAIRNIAHMNTYLVWAYFALAQGENATGQEFLTEAIRLNSNILKGKPCALVDFLVMNSIAEESRDHKELLSSIFAHFPPEITWLSAQYDWAVAMGYLLKGARAIMWGRPEAGWRHFVQGAEMRAEIDETFIQKLTYQLLLYKREFGTEATEEVLRNLAPYLEQVGNRKSVRWLKGSYLVNQAFGDYRTGEFSTVAGNAIGAIANNPKYLLNRGVLSILLRSTIGKRHSGLVSSN